MAIQSFSDRDTESAYLDGEVSRRCPWKSLLDIVCRKLDMLEAAQDIIDLRTPPSNKLEVLKGKLKGLHSIRVNRRWRIVFRWSDEGPEHVRVLDYH